MAKYSPPKTVTVLGAGVTGVATAWYLSQAGFDVTVIERQSGVGLETSFANGGQISVCHATPWANPATPLKALKWLFYKDAPLLYRLNTNSEQWRFIVRFLRECTATRADKNLVQMVNLGLYSRQMLMALCTQLPLQFAQRFLGIMHFYTSANEYQAALAPTKRMQALGCQRVFIDRHNAMMLEPALQTLSDTLIGATYTNEDLSGNAHLFTKELAKHCQNHGVKFLYNTTVKRIHTQTHQPTMISHLTLHQEGQDKIYHSDAYVVCLASYSKRLLDTIGVYLPIFPAKGYSATYQVLDAARVPYISLIDDEYKLVMSRFCDTQDVLRVAGTAEFNGYCLDLDEVRCQAITRRVRSLFKDALDYQTPNYWTGLRPMTPSNVPLIGKAHLGKVKHGSQGRTFDNLWLNTGHGTLGFTHACGSAMALSLLMQGEHAPIEFCFVGYDH